MVVKPDNGVGASDTHKLSSDEELKRFLLYKSTYHPDLSYICLLYTSIVSTPAEIESGLKMVELKSFYEVLVGGRTFTALASQLSLIHILRSFLLQGLLQEPFPDRFRFQSGS